MSAKYHWHMERIRGKKHKSIWIIFTQWPFQGLNNFPEFQVDLFDHSMAKISLYLWILVGIQARHQPVNDNIVESIHCGTLSALSIKIQSHKDDENWLVSAVQGKPCLDQPLNAGLPMISRKTNEEESFFSYLNWALILITMTVKPPTQNNTTWSTSLLPDPHKLILNQLTLDGVTGHLLSKYVCVFT